MRIMFVMLGEIRLRSSFMTCHWTACALSGLSDAGLSASASVRSARARLRGCREHAYRRWWRCRSARPLRRIYAASIDNLNGRLKMPVILWLLGVPLIVVILLMLLHVV
jgi:hypothetical protein